MEIFLNFLLGLTTTSVLLLAAVWGTIVITKLIKSDFVSSLLNKYLPFLPGVLRNLLIIAFVSFYFSIIIWFVYMVALGLSFFGEEIAKVIGLW